MVVLQAKRATSGKGAGTSHGGKAVVSVGAARDASAKAGTAVQNPEVPLTRSTTEYKHL